MKGLKRPWAQTVFQIYVSPSPLCELQRLRSGLSAHDQRGAPSAVRQTKLRKHYWITLTYWTGKSSSDLIAARHGGPPSPASGALPFAVLIFHEIFVFICSLMGVVKMYAL